MNDFAPATACAKFEGLGLVGKVQTKSITSGRHLFFVSWLTRVRRIEEVAN